MGRDFARWPGGRADCSDARSEEELARRGACETAGSGVAWARGVRMGRGEGTCPAW